MNTEADESTVSPPSGSRSGSAIDTAASTTPSILSSFCRIDSSRPKTYSAFCWVAEVAKPSRLKISPIVSDFRRGSPLDSRMAIARGKSLSEIRTSQPFLSADRFLLALIPEPSNAARSEEHTSELQSLMRISYAVFCLKKKKKIKQNNLTTQTSNHTTQYHKPVQTSD